MKINKLNFPCAALESYEMTFSNWDKISETPVEDLWREGVIIERYRKRGIESIVNGAREVNMGGHKVLIVNCTDARIASDVGNELSKGRPFGATFFITKDGGTQFSLRSDENGIDVGEFASKHGGGGHKHAAGLRKESSW